MEDIEFEKRNHVATIGLCFEETRNALGPDQLLQLNEIWDRCRQDDGIRVLVLYSGLEKVFCSGLDLQTALPIWSGMREPETLAEKWFLEDRRSVARAMLKHKDFDKPIIAAIDGLCLTCGFEMVMNCELRIASADAVFRMIEAQLGIMPMSGGNVFLPAQIGKARAMEILLTGDAVTADTLFKWGFLNKVVSKDSLMDESLSLAEKIANNGPEAIQGIIRCGREIMGRSEKEALETEYKIAAPIFRGNQAREGIQAVREKRKPDFG